MERIPEAGDVTSVADETGQVDDDNLTGEEKCALLLPQYTGVLWTVETLHLVRRKPLHTCISIYLLSYKLLLVENRIFFGLYIVCLF